MRRDVWLQKEKQQAQAKNKILFKISFAPQVQSNSAKAVWKIFRQEIDYIQQCRFIGTGQMQWKPTF